MDKEEIKALRKKLNLTQEQFASIIGASHKMTISGWESGKRSPDRFFQDKLKKLEKKVNKQ